MSTINDALLDKLGMHTENKAVNTSRAISRNNAKLSRGSTTSIEDRAISLLGNGVSAEQTALALGVSAARISQLMSQEEFANRVATSRYENLQQHNDRDQRYNNLEDDLIDRLEDMVGYITKPSEVTRTLAVINSAKRRGNSSPEQVLSSQNIVSITLPDTIAKQFSISVDINNQVKKAGDQELLTIPSGTLLDQVQNARNAREQALEYIPDTNSDSDNASDIEPDP